MNVSKLFRRIIHSTQCLDKKFIASLLAIATFVAIPVDAHAAVNWPWTSFLNDLQTEITDVILPFLAIVVIIIAAIGMATGHASEGMKKVFLAIIAIMIGLYASTLVNEIKKNQPTSSSSNSMHMAYYMPSSNSHN